MIGIQVIFFVCVCLTFNLLKPKTHCSFCLIDLLLLKFNQ